MLHLENNPSAAEGKQKAFMFKQAVWISSYLNGFCGHFKKATLHHRGNMERVRGLQNKACAPGVALKDHAGDSLPWAMFGVQHCRLHENRSSTEDRTEFGWSWFSGEKIVMCSLNFANTYTHQKKRRKAKGWAVKVASKMKVKKSR